jgi:uncharacterized metal-binding protein
MTAKAGCGCGGTETVILACSGAADVGEVADRSARLLARERAGNMSCLAGIGARIEGMVNDAKEAAVLLVIDGCPTACGKKAVEGAGITGFLHLQLKDIGLKKGSTPRTEESVRAVADEARMILGKAGAGKTGCCGS